jgi:HPt (histidine-containing phosphotransfer) domain-containing protein
MKGEDERCFAAGMDAFIAKPVALDALSRTLARWMPAVAPAEAGAAATGELFDPEVLRALFGADKARLAGLLGTFAQTVARDGAAIAAAVAGGSTAAAADAAHRLKGAARMAGARPLAEAAAAIESAARGGDAGAMRAGAEALPPLAEATLAAVRQSLG